jgi:hypothetical protein
VIGVWEALRRSGETLSATVRRIGAAGFAAHLEAVMDERWATGPEPEETAVTAPSVTGSTPEPASTAA